MVQRAVWSSPDHLITSCHTPSPLLSPLQLYLTFSNFSTPLSIFPHLRDFTFTTFFACKVFLPTRNSWLHILPVWMSSLPDCSTWSIDCSMPGFLVLHYLQQLAQTHVHWVSDAIQPSHPLSPSSPPALNLSQHLDLFQWVCYLHQVAKVLKLHLQHQSFQCIFSVDFL